MQNRQVSFEANAITVETLQALSSDCTSLRINNIQSIGYTARPALLRAIPAHITALHLNIEGSISDLYFLKALPAHIIDLDLSHTSGFYLRLEDLAPLQVSRLTLSLCDLNTVNPHCDCDGQLSYLAGKLPKVRKIRVLNNQNMPRTNEKLSRLRFFTDHYHNEQVKKSIEPFLISALASMCADYAQEKRHQPASSCLPMNSLAIGLMFTGSLGIALTVFVALMPIIAFLPANTAILTLTLALGSCLLLIAIGGLIYAREENGTPDHTSFELEGPVSSPVM